VKEGFTILIADRNPHVRKLLEREIRAEGYRVRLAKNARDLLEWVYHYEPLDLLILDPDLPDAEDTLMLKKVNNRIPALPVILHGYLTDDSGYSAVLKSAVFVEKRGSSIEYLKKVISDILKKSRAQKVNP
jgi:DNA-binding NtrC family response regulator